MVGVGVGLEICKFSFVFVEGGVFGSEDLLLELCGGNEGGGVVGHIDMVPALGGVVNELPGKSAVARPNGSGDTGEIGKVGVPCTWFVVPYVVAGVGVGLLGEDFEEVEFFGGIVLLEVVGV